MPGLEVMATEDTVGVVLWAWTTDGGTSAARAMRRMVEEPGSPGDGVGSSDYRSCSLSLVK